MHMYYIDPVCNKKIRKKQEFAIIKNQGKVHHFCCLACELLFLKQPDLYLRKNKPPLKISLIL